MAEYPAWVRWRGKLEFQRRGPRVDRTEAHWRVEAAAAGQVKRRGLRRAGCADCSCAFRTVVFWKCLFLFYFVSLRLCWVSLLRERFSSCRVQGAAVWLQCTGSSSWWLLSLQSTGYSSRVLERSSIVRCTVLVALQHVGSSQIRDLNSYLLH